MLALSALSAAAICAGPRAGGAAGPLSLGRGGTCRARRARMASVSGSVYPASEPGSPAVQLFTKEGCTLCDKVKEVLVSVAAEQPHSLEAVDITNAAHAAWFDRYKYDIPVLHMGGQYWTKHRLTREEALSALAEARAGTFASRRAQPDAARLEHR